MSNCSNSLVIPGWRAWIVCLCIIVFASACIAEPAHFHSTSGPSRQNCLLCIASHSVARPAALVTSVALPARCVGILVLLGAALPDFQPVLSLYIRPPPSL